MCQKHQATSHQLFLDSVLEVMVSDSLRVPLQTSGQVGSLMEERHTDSGKPEVILTLMDVLILYSWFAITSST